MPRPADLPDNQSGPATPAILNVPTGKNAKYQADPSKPDGGLRMLLAAIAVGNVSSIHSMQTAWDGVGSSVSGKLGLTLQLHKAVQTATNTWTGAGADAYTTHVGRLTTYGSSLGSAMTGGNSLSSALITAQTALQTAQATVKNITPVDWWDANAQAFQQYGQAFQAKNAALINQANFGMDSYFSYARDTYVPQLQAKGDPDQIVPGTFVPGSTPADQVENLWLQQVWTTAKEMNIKSAQTVANTLTTLAQSYVGAYLALPTVPTAPPDGNTQQPNPPTYPTIPTSGPTVPANTNVHSPNTPTIPAGTNQPTTPASVPNSTVPTSTAATNPQLAAATTPSGQINPGLTNSNLPSTVNPSGLNGITTPTVSPDLGHLTNTAGLTTPMLGPTGLGGVGSGAGGLTASRVGELSVRLWLSTGTLQNSMDNLHSGTQDIQKNYSDTNNNLDFVANQLKNYDDYLNTAVVGGAGGA